MSVSDKNELLFRRGINFNEVPLWQRRGAGVSWENFEKQGMDPRTGEATMAQRRRAHVDAELPIGEAYSAFLRQIVAVDLERSV